MNVERSIDGGLVMRRPTIPCRSGSANATRCHGLGVSWAAARPAQDTWTVCLCRAASSREQSRAPLVSLCQMRADRQPRWRPASHRHPRRGAYRADGADPARQQVPEAAIVAVAARDPARAATFAAKHGIARVADIVRRAARRSGDRRDLQSAAEQPARRVEHQGHARRARTCSARSRSRPTPTRRRRWRTRRSARAGPGRGVPLPLPPAGGAHEGDRRLRRARAACATSRRRCASRCRAGRHPLPLGPRRRRRHGRRLLRDQHGALPRRRRAGGGARRGAARVAEGRPLDARPTSASPTAAPAASPARCSPASLLSMQRARARRAAARCASSTRSRRTSINRLTVRTADGTTTERVPRRGDLHAPAARLRRSRPRSRTPSPTDAADGDRQHARDRRRVREGRAAAARQRDDSAARRAGAEIGVDLRSAHRGKIFTDDGYAAGANPSIVFLKTSGSNDSTLIAVVSTPAAT